MKGEIEKRWRELNEQLTALCSAFQEETGLTVRVLTVHAPPSKYLVEAGLAFGAVPEERAMLESAHQQLRDVARSNDLMHSIYEMMETKIEQLLEASRAEPDEQQITHESGRTAP